MLHPTIASAIRARQLIRFRYHGVQRLVIPLVYGLGSADGELLRAWQLTGPPRAGSRHGWKLFRVVEMSEIAVAHGRFTALEIPPDYNPDDPLMTRIFSRVERHVESGFESQRLRASVPPRIVNEPARAQPLRNSLRKRS